MKVVRTNIAHMLHSRILDGFVFVLNRIVGLFFLHNKGLSKALHAFSTLNTDQTLSFCWHSDEVLLLVGSARYLNSGPWTWVDSGTQTCSLKQSLL